MKITLNFIIFDVPAKAKWHCAGSINRGKFNMKVFSDAEKNMWTTESRLVATVRCCYHGTVVGYSVTQDKLGRVRGRWRHRTE